MVSAIDSRLKDVVSEKQRRDTEALRIYRPYGGQIDFHQSGASEKVIRGGKRSGKTVAAVLEFASVATGQTIIGHDGKPIERHMRMPDPDDPLLMWVIGWGLSHIGQTLYRKLFEPGLGSNMRAIRDLETREWRAFNPSDPDDADRHDESVVVGPAIPSRFIDQSSWSFENKAARTFEGVRLKNGTYLYAFPSSSKHPKQGDAVDFIWIDEDIQIEEHVKEWQDRLPDRDGSLIWSAWPHRNNDALITMSDRAMAVKDDDDKEIMEVVLRQSANPFIPKANLAKARARMLTDEDIRSRDYGDFLFDTIQMYSFVPPVNGIYNLNSGDTYTRETKEDPVSNYWTKDQRFPREWTRYIAMDPSHTRTGIVFGVVPPPDHPFRKRFKKLILIEDELELKKATPDMVAQAIKEKMGTFTYEAFIIDQQIGRQTSAGNRDGLTVAQEYERSFREKGIKSRATENSFIWGHRKRHERYTIVRKWLDGPSCLVMVVMDKTPALRKEFNTYRKKCISGDVFDEPSNPRIHDMMAAFEYLISYVDTVEEPYIDPMEYEDSSNPVVLKAKRMKAKWDKKDNPDYCHIGPTSKY